MTPKIRPESDMPLSPMEITALKYKIMDFIQENDPFGDKISQHELLCLAQYFADAAAARDQRLCAGDVK